ncbi:MAG: hypothetical protein ACKVZ6_04965 [Kineosporiaceae bacterium]|jgi:hypothetical protein
MANPLLSSYRAGENRVTSSTMAVFERIDLALVTDLLGAASGAGSELRTVSFENQVTGDASVPDARISGHFTWLFETKTVRGGYNAEGHDRQQLRGHARLLESDPDALLFVLTPDPVRPAWFSTLDGVQDTVRPRVLWVGFRDLAEAINQAVTDPRRLLGEQTRFLLDELVRLYETDGLLSTDDTVVVAARTAWPEYQRISAYVCQPNRAFRDGLTQLAFYAEGQIQPVVPRILRHEVAVPFTDHEAERLDDAGDPEVATVIRALLAAGTRVDGDAYDVLLLTGPDDAATIRLPQPVVNDTTTASGKPWAWTLGQRYTRLEVLRSGVRRTSEL